MRLTVPDCDPTVRHRRRALSRYRSNPGIWSCLIAHRLRCRDGDSSRGECFLNFLRHAAKMAWANFQVSMEKSQAGEKVR